MTEEAMRKDFEAACIKRWGGSDRGALVIRADGEYENGNVQFGWVCWQGATRAAAPAWLPIATAPRDGTHVLVGCETKTRGWVVHEAWWWTPWDGSPLSHCEWRYGKDGMFPDKSVHGFGAELWMPLPPAPEAKP